MAGGLVATMELVTGVAVISAADTANSLLPSSPKIGLNVAPKLLIQMSSESLDDDDFFKDESITDELPMLLLGNDAVWVIVVENAPGMKQGTRLYTFFEGDVIHLSENYFSADQNSR